MFGLIVIIVMTTRTGISDRGYLSMENTNLNCVFPCVAMFLSLVSVRVKKTSVCEHLHYPCFSMSRPQFGKCVFCRAEFFQTEHWQTGGLEKNRIIYE